MYLRIGVCEDNQEELALLRQKLGDSSYECDVESFSSGEEFLKNYYPGLYDLILMDIYMGRMNGVETVSRIRAADPNVTIAFLTTSTEFTLEGYQQRVDRYILKPIHSGDLLEVLELAARNKNNQSTITISVQRKKQTVFLKDICYAEQSGHALYIYLPNGESLRTTMKLSDLEKMLPGLPFYRCHKSYLINMTQVRYLDNDLRAFIMTGGGCAYIRRDDLREAREIYSRFMFEQVRGKDTTC